MSHNDLDRPADYGVGAPCRRDLALFRPYKYHVRLRLHDEKAVLRMGLVSMILELREQGSTAHSQTGSDVPSADSIQTKPFSAEDRNAQEAISLRTFALRLDTKKRRNQKLGR